MDVNTSASAAELYRAAIETARSGGAPGAPGAPDGSETGATFGDAMSNAAKETVEAIADAEKLSGEMVAGKAEPHSVVEALAAAELALETAVTVRDKVVSAYQEILRMPV